MSSFFLYKSTNATFLSAIIIISQEVIVYLSNNMLNAERRELLVPDHLGAKKLRAISYLEWGNQDAFPVICVHGLTRNAHDFDFLASKLAEKYRVICIDVMGRGRSEYASSISYYRYDQYVLDLQQLVKVLDIDAFHYVGTSMGGIMGMMFASSYPNKIAKMVINDVGPYISRTALASIVSYAAHYPIFSNFAALENYLRTVYAGFGIASEDKWRHFIQHSYVVNDQGDLVLNYDQQIAQSLKFPSLLQTDINIWGVWNMIAKNLPILLLKGEFSTILSDITASQMRFSHPAVDFTEIKGVGHAPSLMNDEEIELIYNWL